MSDPVVDNLIVDLLEWLAQGDRSYEGVRGRPYEEVMDAWRTSCPRLTVWEDASDRGLVTKEEVQGRSMVRITPAGRNLLRRRHLQKTRASDRVERSA